MLFLLALQIGTKLGILGASFSIVTVLALILETHKHNINRTIPLNQPTIITFRPISNYYRIGVGIPPWFVDVYLQAWVYTGQTPDSLEGKVDQIQIDLARIEDLRLMQLIQSSFA